MQRLLYWLTIGLVAGLIYARPAQTQTIPITGHVGDASSGVPPGMSVKFQLSNCGANVPRIVGSFGILKQNFTLTPDATGLLTGTIWPNDLINCGGVTGTTRYWITTYLDGVPQTLSACYAVLSTMGTLNLDVATPCTSATPPPPPGGPYDATYANLTLMGLLSGGNALFSGTVQANQFLLNAVPSPCPSGDYVYGLTANLNVICAALPATGLTSFAGRGAAAAVPTSGDYTCGMVTGCQPALSFSARFAVSGSSVDLATVGSAATATCPTSVTYDAFGRITSITSGTCSAFATATNVTGSRFLATPYHNTGTTPMYVSGYATISGGSGDSTLTFLVGPSSPTLTCDKSTTTATIGGEAVEFHCIVSPGSFYEVTGTNLISAIGNWLETQ
jgi:hypothetical protein